MSIWQSFINLVGFGGTQIPSPSGRQTLVKATADDIPIYRQFQRIGGAVTPEQFSSYLRAADGGYLGPIVSMAMESRQKDGHLQGILGQREDALQELEWEFYYPGADSGSTRGQRQKRFLEDQTVGNPEFEKMLAHISGDFYPGFSATEMIRRKDGGKLVLDRTVPIDARRCAYSVRDGRLVFRDDPLASATEQRFEEFEPGKFVVTKRRMNGDVEAREGLMRVLLWSALFRNWSLSDWLKLAEIAWKPYRVVKYDKSGINHEERAQIELFLEQLTSSGTLLIPNDVDLEVMWPQGGGGGSSGQGNHQALHSAMGREMSKAVLGQDGVTEQGDVGSMAKATVQQRVSDKKVVSDARSCSRYVTEQFCRPSIAMNFGDQADVPHFRMKVAKPTDIAKTSNAISVLVSAGLKVPAKWARQQIGSPDPKEGEELVSDGKPEPATQPPATPDGMTPAEMAQDTKDEPAT